MRKMTILDYRILEAEAASLRRRVSELETILQDAARAPVARASNGAIREENEKLRALNLALLKRNQILSRERPGADDA